MYHKPALLEESLDALAVRPEGTYVDVTFGGGGHARAIMERLGSGRLIAFDQDEDAVSNTLKDERFFLVNRNFRYMIHFLRYLEAVPVDGILADLGISSHQIDTSERGFSIRFDGPIDLRMNRRLKVSARDILNEWEPSRLARLFAEYGELEQAHRIARAIESARKVKSLETTGDLKSAVMHMVPSHKLNQFLAQVFQALRIQVNNELDALQELLTQSLDVLKPGGRLAVISYHSLEDRMVKNFFRAGNVEGKINKDFYGNVVSGIKALNQKVICPGERESLENPRSRSARLRVGVKL
ncbi:MAG TPA: 16S rRNA (cytosine(1402)-N(4))-methyltransferase RsmH [Bacteroidales bacterium]|nr:16S rRNA (cytosine(1402)-N(4))-methyltransferase RsmH [Bacteroidales bacterium]HSA44379.1 16S rRNA (cytosine(1402)-N(4))-methyltransferase RsmH [Bacteroidales bacterium]